ncbi:MAG: hypothetical protein HQL07_18205 [Nitrospirae bacterium]|nr:hypothetical protein [Magnetococcales bacterium]
MNLSDETRKRFSHLLAHLFPKTIGVAVVVLILSAVIYMLRLFGTLTH